MRRAILVHLILGLMFNVALYLALSFVHWDFVWFKQFPAYTEEGRLSFLFSTCGLNAALHIFIMAGRDIGAWRS